MPQSELPPCMWKGCRKRARWAMLLVDIDAESGLYDPSTAEPAELCEEHMRAMGYDASFPGATDG